jgi:hypothetical protein
MSWKPEEATDLGYSFIGNEKLPRGLSFPIKRSALDEFLRREGITKVTGVAFCGNSGHNAILTAEYYGPRRKSSHHTLNLWIYAVRSDLRRSVEELIVHAAFPRLTEWLLSFSDDSHLRAKTDHSTSFALEEIPVIDPLASPVGGTGLRLIQCTRRRGKLK